MRHVIRSDINVTPFVDVVLVLLIIFMVVTPSIVERVKLPAAEHPEDKPARPGQVRLAVEWPDAAIWIDDRRCEEHHALAKLTAIHEESPRKELVLFADSRLDVGDVKKVIHMADEAGFKRVGLIALKSGPEPYR